MLNPNNDQLPILTREAPVVSTDEESRTVEVVWTTGAAVERYDWLSGTRYMETLDVTDKAIRLDRLNAGGPVLDGHKSYSSVADAFAVVERAWVEKGQGLARIRFPASGIDANADMIFNKIKDGIISRLSCGYRRLKIEIDKSKKPSVWRVVDWEPFEISFVLVPADIAAKVRDDEQAGLFRNENVSGQKPSRNGSLESIALRARRRKSRN